MSTQLVLPMFDVAPKLCRCGFALADHVAVPRELFAKCVLPCPCVSNAEDEGPRPKRVLLTAWLARIYGPTFGRISSKPRFRGLFVCSPPDRAPRVTPRWARCGPARSLSLIRLSVWVRRCTRESREHST